MSQVKEVHVHFDNVMPGDTISVTVNGRTISHVQHGPFDVSGRAVRDWCDEIASGQSDYVTWPVLPMWQPRHPWQDHPNPSRSIQTLVISSRSGHLDVAVSPPLFMTTHMIEVAA